VKTYTLAYSPCPNDTYVLGALANGFISDAPPLRVTLSDIDELNNAAARGAFEFVKVSYGAVPHLVDRYHVLRAGGAIGRGCGPLLVARPQNAPELFSGAREKHVAIPGERTTAFMLLQLALGTRPRRITQVRFDAIVRAVAEGAFDAGLIIHESRFTYRDAGLIAIADLGEWWENMTLLPIPLGAILARKDVDRSDALAVADAIRKSLAFARANEERVMPYVRAHAAEIHDNVIRQHIALYVNEFTDDLGDAGIEAVHALLARARDAGISREATPEFV
jgi:1,4-dihydroxy-6-naphthoate synthase